MKCDSIKSNEQVISDLIAFKISLSHTLWPIGNHANRKPYSVSMPNLLQLKAIYLPFPSFSIKKRSCACVCARVVGWLLTVNDSILFTFKTISRETDTHLPSLLIVFLFGGSSFNENPCLTCNSGAFQLNLIISRRN